MALALGLAALYVRPFVLRGWIPHDEGTIAQSAERVLEGEVPHRDFDEGYTGGLSYLHAAAFRVGGTRLATLRWLLFGAFLAFAAAVFALSRRLGPPWVAILLTLLATVWSVPNYFASLPSWYNLFLATLMTLALARSIETPRPGWTFLAGLCAGASVLAKQVGLYAVAAGLLFLVYRERQTSSARSAPAGGRTSFLAAKTLGALAFIALLAVLFGRRRDPMDLVEFVLPPALLSAFLLRDEVRQGRGDSAGRFRALVRAVGPFLGGAALPVAAFGAAFAAAGSLRPLLLDVFVHSLDPTRTAQLRAIEPAALGPAALYGLLVLFPAVASGRRERAVAAVLAFLLAGMLVLGAAPEVYRTAWNAARSLPLVVAAGALGVLRRGGESDAGEGDRARLFLLAASAALVGLVQFPFASPIYFCYAAPLALLGMAALVRADARAPRLVHGVVLAFLLLFAALWMNRGYVFQLGRYFAPYVARTPLDLPRAGLLVPERDAREYTRIVHALQEHSPGRDLYAGPDCPEIYFLSGRRNVTRSFFDYQGELYERPAELLRRIDERAIAAVVVNRSPAFSRPFGPELLNALRERFPRSEQIGRFTLMWRSPEASALAYNPLP